MENLISKLVQFEKENKWKKAIQYLYIEWKQNPMDIHRLIRVIGECWYVMVMWDSCIPVGTASYEECEDILQQAITFGDFHFCDSLDYLCLVGYIATLTPDLLVTNNPYEYVAIEQKGRRYLAKAIELQPQNPVVTVIYSGFTNTLEKHQKLQEQYLHTLKDFPWDASAVSRYFYNILIPK